jgi:hypothetical protein
LGSISPFEKELLMKYRRVRAYMAVVLALLLAAAAREKPAAGSSSTGVTALAVTAVGETVAEKTHSGSIPNRVIL